MVPLGAEAYPPEMLNPRFLLAVLLTLCATPLALSLATTADGDVAGLWAFVIIALAVSAALLRVERRRDPRPAAIFALVAGFVVVSGVVVGMPDAKTLWQRALLGAYAVGGIAGLIVGATNVRASLRERDEVPNTLLERVPADRIFESDGVHWTLSGGGTVGGANIASLTVFLQSVVAAPRTVTIELEDTTGTLNRRGSVAWQPIEPVLLEPGAVVAVHVPLVAGREPAAATAVYARIRANGQAARRILRVRGVPPKDRVRWWEHALGLLAGFVSWGGGVSVQIANPTASASAIDPPPVARELVRASLAA